MNRPPLVWLFSSLLCCAIPNLSSASEWVEDSFEDFRDGAFFDGGSNLYVSARGRIQIINRWDLNGDGHLDVIMPSGHGQTEKEDIYIYLNTGNDISGDTLIKVAANGSRDGLVYDFNLDGKNDLAVCNNDNGTTDRTNSFIYFGTETGYSAEQRIELPAHASTGVAAGDFNLDGWPDLALACQYDEGTRAKASATRKSFVYWNSETGFSPDRRWEVSVGGRGASAVAAADMDGDGIEDLIQSVAGKTSIYLSSKGGLKDSKEASIVLDTADDKVDTGDFNGDGQRDLVFVGRETVKLVYAKSGGYPLEEATQLPGIQVADVAVADFNRDGKDDVGVANYCTPEGATWIKSYVYLSDDQGFSTDRRLELPTIGASGISAGDLDGDGWPDIVVNNQRTTNLHKVLSYVYWNQGGDFRFGNHTQLGTQGVNANTIGDVNNDGKPDVVFFNHEGYQRDGLAHTRLFWGDGTRNFDLERSIDIPSHYVTSIAQADLDDDGFVELLMSQGRFINGIAHEQHSIFVYWNGPEGLVTQANLTQENSIGGIGVQDFNRDGWLDIFGGTSVDPKDSSVVGFPIYWGSPDGFTFKNRSVVQTRDEPARGPLAMDIDKNGFVDLVTEIDVGKVRIYWGSEAPFSLENSDEIDLGREDVLMYIKGADLNNDGYLDLVLPLRQVGHETELTSYIYYGSAEGFKKENRGEVPSYGPYDMSIADLNQDGWLDMVFNSYKGNETRDFPTLLYWGSEDGFSAVNRTSIPGNTSVGIETADYDGDGWIDILSGNHRTEGSTVEPGPHRSTTESMLYWGGPEGYSPEARWDFLSVGPHAINIRDVGNSYDRGLYEDYFSSPFPVPQGEKPVSIAWEAETPHGSQVKFQVRVANSEQGLTQSAWTGPNGEESWFESNGAKIPASEGKWIAYRARLVSPNGGPTPYLTGVTVDFE